MGNLKNHRIMGKLSIEIKQTKDKSYKVVVTQNGERNTYPIDAPEVKRYNDIIQFQLGMMKSTNADRAKVSFTE